MLNTLLTWLVPLIWAAFALYGPIDRHATNYFKHNAIFMWKADVAVGGNHRDAVLVQENGEWRLAKVLSIIVGVVLAYLGVPALANLIIVIVADSATRVIRIFDIAGHGAEIIAAGDIPNYRADEIERMLGDPKRDGMTAEEVDALLKRWHWLARITHWLGTR